tara:strand:- start:12284 stop:12772 length:489 start_codon:yes stop_codon:yes gene_type:complete
MNSLTGKLNSKWTLWAHLPHDTDWSLKSYIKIMNIESVDETVALYKNIPDNMIKNCMLFMMRDGINPTWEDDKNKNGGCFSYKIPNKCVIDVWKSTSYMVTGETISNEQMVSLDVNGISISPKKNFCIVKIWFSSCSNQNPKLIECKYGLSHSGCIFKKHIS